MSLLQQAMPRQSKPNQLLVAQFVSFTQNELGLYTPRSMLKAGYCLRKR